MYLPSTCHEMCGMFWLYQVKHQLTGQLIIIIIVILKQEIDSKCRLCKQHEETIDHLTSGCPILAKNENLMRHGKVCTHLHYSICKALGIETTDKWYTHMPKPVCEEGDVTVLWNQAVHTDREVTANRSDIIIKNKKEETCTLIDVAIPTDRNLCKRKRKRS